MSSSLVGLALAAMVTSGCETASAERATTSKVDPKADALLRKMSTGLGNTKMFQFDADHTLEVVTNQGEVLQFVAQSRVAVERPNKARSDRIGPIADATLYYDGKQLTIYGKRANLYATAQAPDKLDAAIDFARDKLGLEAPAADLLYADAYAGLMEDVVSGTYIGLEPVGNQMCHHLAFRGNETDWQIWIEDGARALPCRFVIRSKKVSGTPQFSVAFSNWNLEPRLDAAFFQFTPPPKATEIGFLSLEQQKQEKKGRLP